jgi:hypothetical protein
MAKAKKTWEEKHEAKAEKKSTRLEKKAGRLDIKAATVGDRISDLKKPEGKRAERLGQRQENILGRAEELRSRANYYRPNAPAVPNTPNEPYQDAAPPPAPPPYTPPQPSYDPNTGLQHSLPGTEEALAPYFVGGGKMADQYAQWNQNEMGQIDSNTVGRFPSMFAKYVDVANREADRQQGAINTSLGSRGALYSSANLGQQADMRQRTAMDIAKYGGELQTQLEDQRAKEWAQVMGNQGGIASAEWGAREGAAGRVWQDFLRRSDIPPEFNAGQQWASSQPGGGHTVTY